MSRHLTSWLLLFLVLALLPACGPSPRTSADFTNEMWGKSQFWVFDRMGKPDKALLVDGKQVLVWENEEIRQDRFVAERIQEGQRQAETYQTEVRFFCRITATVDSTGKVLRTTMDANGDYEACDGVVNRAPKSRYQGLPEGAVGTFIHETGQGVADVVKDAVGETVIGAAGEVMTSAVPALGSKNGSGGGEPEGAQRNDVGSVPELPPADTGVNTSVRAVITPFSDSPVDSPDRDPVAAPASAGPGTREAPIYWSSSR